MNFNKKLRNQAQYKLQIGAGLNKLLFGSYPIHDNIAAKMKQRTKIWVH